MCHVSCQIAKNGDEQAVSNHGSSTVKGRRRKIKAQEAGEQGTGGGRF